MVGLRFFKRIELFSPQYCFAQPNPRGLDSQFQSMSMVRSPKSISGAVEVALGNAPYKIAIALSEVRSKSL
ncbi:MAG: hypothetical protein DWQ58_20825 [Microcystis aeruginosa TA09]|nr:MAG: hypothetical protein DWQ58_20825 [Microcystis aeruginosa TA09]